MNIFNNDLFKIIQLFTSMNENICNHNLTQIFRKEYNKYGALIAQVNQTRIIHHGYTIADAFVFNVELNFMRANEITSLTRAAVAFDNTDEISMKLPKVIIGLIISFCCEHPIKEQQYPNISATATQDIIGEWQNFMKNRSQPLYIKIENAGNCCRSSC